MDYSRLTETKDTGFEAAKKVVSPIMLGLWFAILAVGLTACGPTGKLYSGDDIVILPKTYSFDGVKLIVAGVESTRPDGAYLQDAYTVSQTRHLLLRFESLTSRVDEVDLSNDGKVLVEVNLTDPQTLNAGLDSLRLCPLTHNWMMAATWEKANPFFKSGKWQTPGGDFTARECVQGVRVKPPLRLAGRNSASASLRFEPKDKKTKEQTSAGKQADEKKVSANSVPDASDTGFTLYFDVTQWFVDYPRGRNANYGLVLIGGPIAISVIGDKSGTYSPRFHYAARR